MPERRRRRRASSRLGAAVGRCCHIPAAIHSPVVLVAAALVAEAWAR